MLGCWPPQSEHLCQNPTLLVIGAGSLSVDLETHICLCLPSSLLPLAGFTGVSGISGDLSGPTNRTLICTVGGQAGPKSYFLSQLPKFDIVFPPRWVLICP